MGHGERWRRGGIAGATVLAVLLLGMLMRAPAPPQLAIDARTDPLPVLAPATVAVRPLDPVYLTDVRGRSLELGEGTWTAESDDGQLLAVGTRGGPVTVYATGSFQPVAFLEATPNSARAWFTPEGDALVFSVAGALVLHPLDGSEPTETRVRPGIVQPLPGGRAAVFATRPSARVLVVDLRAQSLVTEEPLPGDVHGIAWDVERERLYVAGGEQVTAVDLAVGAIAATVEGLPGAARQVVVGADGTRLYIATQEAVHALDSTTLAEVATLNESVHALLASPDGRWLLAGRPDGPLLVDATRLQPVAPLGGPSRYPVGFHPTGVLYTSGPGPHPDGSTLLAIEPATLRVVGTRTLLHPGGLLPRTSVVTERIAP